MEENNNQKDNLTVYVKNINTTKFFNYVFIKEKQKYNQKKK